MFEIAIMIEMGMVEVEIGKVIIPALVVLKGRMTAEIIEDIKEKNTDGQDQILK